MKISQILNNNVALVKRGGNEVFVVAKGIGFKKKKGQQIAEEEVEKMYIL
ncbi:MAG: CAT RNA binding domain-containing protein, partial [Enterococcus sp.]